MNEQSINKTVWALLTNSTYTCTQTISVKIFSCTINTDAEMINNKHADNKIKVGQEFSCSCRQQQKGEKVNIDNMSCDLHCYDIHACLSKVYNTAIR